MTDPVVVVGDGIGGNAAARALGEAGADVVILDAQSVAPYDRPPLSKKLVTSKVEPSDLLLTSADWAQAHPNVELRLRQQVADIDPSARTLRTESGEEQRWSSLVLATGGSPRRLDLPGAELPGIGEVNDLAGAVATRDALAAARQVVVVGAGFIGCEVAAALVGADKQVTVIERGSHPLEAALGEQVSQWMLGLHVANGVNMVLDAKVQAFEGSDRVERVVTDRGTHDAEVVVTAIGIVENLTLAQVAGCDIDRRVLVDSHMRTSVEGVYAIGDIVSYPCALPGASVEDAPLYHSEHYNVAVGHGRTAARSILGDPVPYEEMPTFWSDQFGLTMNCIGAPELADDVVIRGDLTENDFIALYLRNGWLVAALAVGQRREYRSARKLLMNRVPVAASELAEGVSLQDLQRAGTPT